MASSRATIESLRRATKPPEERAIQTAVGGKGDLPARAERRGEAVNQEPRGLLLRKSPRLDLEREDGGTGGANRAKRDRALHQLRPVGRRDDPDRAGRAVHPLGQIALQAHPEEHSRGRGRDRRGPRRNSRNRNRCAIGRRQGAGGAGFEGRAGGHPRQATSWLLKNGCGRRSGTLLLAGSNSRLGGKRCRSVGAGKVPATPRVTAALVTPPTHPFQQPAMRRRRKSIRGGGSKRDRIACPERPCGSRPRAAGHEAIS